MPMVSPRCLKLSNMQNRFLINGIESLVISIGNMMLKGDMMKLTEICRESQKEQRKEERHKMTMKTVVMRTMRKKKMIPKMKEIGVVAEIKEEKLRMKASRFKGQELELFYQRETHLTLQ